MKPGPHTRRQLQGLPSLGGPAIPGGDGDPEGDDAWVFDQILHSLGHAEDYCDEEDYLAAQTWALIAQAWGVLL